MPDTIAASHQCMQPYAKCPDRNQYGIAIACTNYINSAAKLNQHTYEYFNPNDHTYSNQHVDSHDHSHTEYYSVTDFRFSEGDRE